MALHDAWIWRQQKMARSPQYEQGRRAGLKWAVTFIHRWAETMNDPHAKIVLDCAAFNLGWHRKYDRKMPKVIRDGETKRFTGSE